MRSEPSTGPLGKRILMAHANAIRGACEHAWRQGLLDPIEDDPDYVVMLIPGEHLLTAALEQDPTLPGYAFEKKFCWQRRQPDAIARTVAAVWRQDASQRKLARSASSGKELYDRLPKPPTIFAGSVAV